MDIQIIALDGHRIAFGIDLHTDRPGNTPQIFIMSAEKGVHKLKIVKNDLFGRLSSKSRFCDLLFFQIKTFTPLEMMFR